MLGVRANVLPKNDGEHDILKSRSVRLFLFAVVLAATVSSAQSTSPQFVSPAKDSTTGCSVNVSWTAFSPALTYYLYVGSAAGLSDIYGSGETMDLSRKVQAPGSSNIFLTLWWKQDDGWHSTDSTFKTGICDAKVIFPADKAVEVNPESVTVSWQGPPDAQAYFLKAGSSPGAVDYGQTGEVTATSATFNFPALKTVFLRIFTKKASGWSFTDSQFTTAGGVSHLLYPADGQSGLDTAVTLQWSQVPDATYAVSVGKSPGTADVFSLADTSSNTAPLTLAADTRYYVTITTKRPGTQQATSTFFTTGAGVAHILTPANNAAGLDPESVNVTWSSVSDAQAYFLKAGSAPGAVDYGQTGEISGTSATLKVPALATVYLQIFTKKATGWYYSDSQFTTGGGASRLIAPVSGQSGLDPTQITLQWSNVSDALGYFVEVGTSPGGSNVLKTEESPSQTATLHDLPQLTTFYVTVHTHRQNGFVTTSATFTTGPGMARILTPVAGAVVDPRAVQVTWSTFPDAMNYYLKAGSSPGAVDYGQTGEIASNTATFDFPPLSTVYLRIFTHRSSGWMYTDSQFTTSGGPSKLLQPPNGQTGLDTTSITLQWSNIADALGYSVQVGTTASGSDVLNSSEITSLSTTLSNLAPLTTYYVTLNTHRSEGWVSSASTFTTGTGRARILTPIASPTGIDPHAVSVTWTPVSDAVTYFLKAGSTPGAADYGQTGEVTATSATLDVPPLATVYLRIYTHKSNGWYFTDSQFSTSGGDSRLLTPANGSNGVPFSVKLTWSAVPDAVGYRVQVGTSQGAADVLDLPESLALTANLSGLAALTDYYVTVSTHNAQGWRSTASTFRTGIALSHLLQPAAFATAVDPKAPLVWETVANAEEYQLWIGTAPGSKNVLDTGSTQSTTVTANLGNRVVYYTRLFTRRSGNEGYTDSVFTTAPQIAQLVFPADHETGVDPVSRFQWNTLPSALAYSVWVGTTPGHDDLFHSGETTLGSMDVPALPINATVYVRLYTHLADGWYYKESSFTTGTGVSHLIAPRNGESAFDPAGHFAWSSITDAEAYQLIVGTSAGADDVYHGAETLELSADVPLSPSTAYFATIATRKAGVWMSTSVTFTTNEGLAKLTYPVNGQQSVNPLQTFTWQQVPKARAYVLFVGTAPGKNDLYTSDELLPSESGAVVSTLAPGGTYYTRLWTKFDDGWKSQDVTFSTDVAPQWPSQDTFLQLVRDTTATVRYMAPDITTNVPLPGSTLEQVTKARGKAATDCVDFMNALVVELAKVGVLSRRLTLTVTGTFYEGHTLVEYYDPYQQAWSVADSTFGLIYYDEATQHGQSAVELQGYARASQWDAFKPEYVTTLGESIASDDYMDPATYFANIVPTGTDPLESVDVDPLNYLDLRDPGEVSGAVGYYLFKLPDTNSTIQVVDNGATINISSEPGTTWAHAYKFHNGWQITSIPEGAQLYTFHWFVWTPQGL
jgi:hypothetical protein